MERPGFIQLSLFEGSSSASLRSIHPAIGDGFCIFRVIAVTNLLCERGKFLGEKAPFVLSESHRPITES